VDPSNSALWLIARTAPPSGQTGGSISTAAEFDVYRSWIDKAAGVFQAVGEVVAGRTKSLASMNANSTGRSWREFTDATVVGQT